MGKSRIVVLSGAGLSADSGIATYRGVGGVYQGLQAERVMSAAGLRNNPELVHAMCDDRRAELRDAAPNAAHDMLATLSRRYGDRFIHFTQNIDDLAERAGAAETQHVHGHLTRMRSIGNSKVTCDIGYRRYWSGPDDLAPDQGYRFRCPRSNSYFRPDVVLFNETAPLYPRLFKTMKNLRRVDLLMVIGTQGVVLPVGRWALMAPCRKILNNLHDCDAINPDLFDFFVKEKAADAAGRLLDIAVSHLGEP